MSDLHLALHLAEVADAISLSYLDRPVPRHTKPDGSLVSDADLEIDTAIVRILARQRPGDAVLAEESGPTAGISGRRWLIDPIDGTSSFLGRQRNWGTHIALESNGTLDVAVMTRPTEGLSYWAVRGAGAHRRSASGDDRLRITTAADLNSTRIGGLIEPGNPDVSLLQHHFQWCTDDVSVIAAMLEGRLEAVLDDGGFAWDQAPPVLLVLEAGGAFCDPHGGERFDQGWGLYSSHPLQAQLMRLLNRPVGA